MIEYWPTKTQGTDIVYVKHGVVIYLGTLWIYLYSAEVSTIKELVERAIRKKINLSDAILNWAILRGANLSGANLCGANLSDADLSDANLTSVVSLD
jgi:hypothetical protein